ncbi:lipid kinase [soil metagenome]
MRSLALLANPDSGSGDAAELPATLRELGAEVAEFEIGEFEEAASSGAERLVVAGGDGSIAPAACAAARHHLPLAVLPAGTANDFARVHDLPLDLDQACELAVKGEVSEAIDIALMGERPFLNVASIGLSPAAAEKAHGLKRFLGPLAYMVGAARAAISAPAVHCRVSCDDEEWFSGKVWQLTVACSGAFGGGSTVAADPADGRLDLVLIKAGSRLWLPLHAYGLRAGGIENYNGVLDHRCRSVRVETSDGTTFNVDGELIEAGDTTFTVEPEAVELITG